MVKVFLLALALLASGFDLHGQEAPEKLPVIRAAFWNIQWFPGRRPDATEHAEQTQVEAVHREVQKMEIDLLGMEEVRDFEHANLAISPLPGFKVDVCSNFPPREGQVVGQQVAIASRFTPMSAWVEMWKTAGALTPPRGFAFAAYEIAPRQLVLVYALHLKSNRGEAVEDIGIREESSRQLLAHMSVMKKAYGNLGTLSWIVGGDFNTAPDDPRFANETTTRLLTKAGFEWCWQDVPAPQRMTLPGDKFFPAACFDQIFYRHARLQSARVIDTSPRASDHRAIVAELALARAEPGDHLRD